ncbi:MAG TPA: hypothetical protein VE291_09690 [Terracidiphilus sp.]|nr:hypothetical protein [Terracidiphilus sp.]
MKELPLNPAVESAASAQQAHPPLCVDLDGTPIKSDSLYDGFCQFARTRLLELWRAPLWVLGGKARLKEALIKSIEGPSGAKAPLILRLLRHD